MLMVEAVQWNHEISSHGEPALHSKLPTSFKFQRPKKIALETSRYPNSSSGCFFSRAHSDFTGMMVSRPSYPKINRYQNILLFFDIYIYNYKISVPNTVGNMFVSLVILNRLWSLVYFFIRTNNPKLMLGISFFWTSPEILAITPSKLWRQIIEGTICWSWILAIPQWFHDLFRKLVAVLGT